MICDHLEWSGTKIEMHFPSLVIRNITGRHNFPVWYQTGNASLSH